MTGSTHEPVLVKQVIDALNINAAGCYLDGTFGRGGHSAVMLKHLSETARLIALDKDDQAIDYANQRFATEHRLTAIKSSFAKLDDILSLVIPDQKLDGALFDLGVSSPQLDQAQRGFSFRHNGPLDMRMDQSNELTAEKWLAQASQAQLRDVFSRYGEERYANRIAKQIVLQRQNQPITSTAQLATLIAECVPTKEKDKHPATRVFQSIRIHINRELDEIKQMLPKVVDWLKPGGRLVVISFHSLEDRIVKQFMRQAAIGDQFPIDLAVTQDMLNPTLKLLGKAVRPDSDEIHRNPRARSAILRVAEKLESRA